MPKVKPRSSRRAPPLKDSDYDHEISLSDHSPPHTRLRPTSPPNAGSRSSSARRLSSIEPLVRHGSPSSAQREQAAGEHADDLEEQATQETEPPPPPRGVPDLYVEQPTPSEQQPTQPQLAAASDARVRTPAARHLPESVIDILYENQRGLFLCGVALFSSSALGNLDPTPWTNFAHRPSPTDITNAQVPDPSWEWAWPEWRVNHDEEDDEGGWQYSFMFAKKFSWHGPSWYSSFVRRRAWIRKRVKKVEGLAHLDSNLLLNPQYFTVQPADDVRRTESRTSRGSAGPSSKASFSQASGSVSEIEERPDIDTIEMLMQYLRAARIDREKIEAIDSFLEHAGDDLGRLQHEMHEVMSLFIFQASRRLLLTRITREHDEAVAQRKRQDTPQARQRVTALIAAVEHAEEEVRKLEYWSDIKEMVENGETKTGVDREKGWGSGWQGLDQSGPKEPETPDTQIEGA